MPTLPEESMVIPVEVAMSEPLTSFSLLESDWSIPMRAWVEEEEPVRKAIKASLEEADVIVNFVSSAL